jgi:hypothetical protein
MTDSKRMMENRRLEMATTAIRIKIVGLSTLATVLELSDDMMAANCSRSSM